MLLVSYARQLEKKGRMKLVYVMMQEECVQLLNMHLMSFIIYSKLFIL
jgi:hypothetical protein